MGDQVSGYDYVYTPDFFLFYNISDPNGLQDGNNAIYVWNKTANPEVAKKAKEDENYIRTI